MDTASSSVEKLIEDFKLSCQAEGKSPKTIDWYTCFLVRFKCFLDKHDMSDELGDIDKNDIRQFIVYLQVEARTPRTGKILSPVTVQGYVRTLKSFFSWAVREGYVFSNPMNKIPIPKAPIKVINTFTAEQVTKLVDQCYNNNGSRYRDLSIILLMLDSGLRVSELKNIYLRDVDLADGLIRVRIAKGGKERIVPIGNLVQKYLWKYINQFRPDSPTKKIAKLFLSDKGLPLTKSGNQQCQKGGGQQYSN